MIKVLVGSTNPVKCAAAQSVFNQIDKSVVVEGIVVPSGVSVQPWGDEETRAGAISRARAALGDADFGVGFEGGVIKTEHGIMTCAWCAVVNRDGVLGIGGGVHTLLPISVQRQLLSGKELGLAMDVLTGEHNTKQNQGAIGILTSGLSSRKEAYAQILRLALARFQSVELFA